MPYTTKKSGTYRYQKTYKGIMIDLTAKTKEALEEKVYLRKQKIDKGEAVGAKNITVETWAEKWLETYKKPKITDKHYRNIKGYINNNIIPSVGSVPMTDVRQYRLQEILNKLEGKSSSHVKKVKIVIEAIFRTATNNCIIDRDPSVGLILPKTTQGTH